MFESIFIDELKNLNNIQIIDIRSVEKYNNNHMPGAINIPFDTLMLNYNKYLNNNSKYYIYCQKGYSSKTLCNILTNNGYKVVNIIGGYEAWMLSK